MGRAEDGKLQRGNIRNKEGILAEVRPDDRVSPGEWMKAEENKSRAGSGDRASPLN